MIDYLRLVEIIDPEALPADTIAVTVIASPAVYGEPGPETGEAEQLSPAVHLDGLYVLTARDGVDEDLWAAETTLAEIDRESGVMLRRRRVDLVGCTLSPQWAGAPGGPLAMAEPDIEGRKETMRRQVDDLWAAHQAVGYDHDFGELHGVHRLQTRESDLPFWLALAQTASIQVGMGNGDAPHGAIRTADNVNVPVKASEALATMLGMQAHLGTILANSWALKDLITEAANMEALDEIDVNHGWVNPS